MEQLGEECAASVAVPRRAAFLFVVVTAFCMALKKNSATRGLSCRADVITVERLLLFCSDNRDDQLPRTCALAFLSRLDSSNLQHQRLMEELVMDLLKKVQIRLGSVM